jgi:glc operon protein GlcG
MRPSLIAALAVLAVAGVAHAQAPAAQATPPAPTLTAYGPNITLEQAMQVVNAANAEAAKRKLPATITIVDTSGALVYYQRATNAPGTAEAFATRKAVAAVKERHPTSADQQRLKDNPGATPFLPDFFPFGGGFPLVVDGKVVGAIGETGGADEDVAKAGAAALH